MNIISFASIYATWIITDINFVFSYFIFYKNYHQ